VKASKPILHGRDHAPGGADPIPGLASIDAMDALIMATGPAGFWKLDEPTGPTAHDSSGNGHHMNPPGGGNPPDFNQSAGPTGAPTALWPVGSSTVREHVTMHGYSSSEAFTAGIWFQVVQNQGAGINELFGQGQPFHVGPTGWELMIGRDDTLGQATPYVFCADSAGSTTLTGAWVSYGTWIFFVFVHDPAAALVSVMYINGALEIGVFSGDGPAAGNTDTWIGSDGYATHGTYAQGLLFSNAFIIPRALTADEIQEIFEAGTPTGNPTGQGKVWTADGQGFATWAWPTIEVKY